MIRPGILRSWLFVAGSLVLLAGPVSVRAAGIHAGYSGSWFDPAKDGQGFTIQILSDQAALATWFTFDVEGRQAWLQGVGRIEGSRLVFDQLNRYIGPSFGGNQPYDPGARQAIASGQLVIDFSTCMRAVAMYSGENGLPDDILRLERLTQVLGFPCEGEPPVARFPMHHGLSGAWYAPALDGQGWVVEVLDQDQALVYWFTYDEQGQQRWMLGVGRMANERLEVRELDWFEGGRFGPNFDPQAVKRKPWGRVNLSLWPCRGASASYRKGNILVARQVEITGLEPLVSISGTESCPPHVNKWTAARLLDQAAFGPTPAEEQQVYQLGITGWIEDQLALPPSLIAYRDLVDHRNFLDDDGNPITDVFHWDAAPIRVMNQFLAGPDQLRLRMTWALSQLLVVSSQGVEPGGVGAYFNLLQRNALGTFRDLLREVTLSPAMGHFLDNAGSQGASDRCPDCIPNENYARELLMLFTIGVNALNLDGSIQKDASGRPIEAFTQDDVMALARALSGWDFQGDDWPQRLLYPLGPSRWNPGAHDRGEKRLLGHTIPAGQGIHADLEMVLDILMGHPNTAPFVSYRLIQHLTTSNPSPAYVERIARVFLDNGEGTRGDLAAVARAILLDPEARRGDDPNDLPANFGRIRETLFHHLAVLRGLECTELPHRNNTEFASPEHKIIKYVLPWIVRNLPFNSPEVFNFYPPDNLIAGTQLVSPEHLILNLSGIESRFSAFSPWSGDLSVCNYAVFHDAAQRGGDAFLRLLKDRYLRGRAVVWHEQEMQQLADVLHRYVSGPPNNCQCEDFFYGTTVGSMLLGHEFGVIR